MALRPVQVNIKTHDEEALGRFWAQALGWESESEAPGVFNLTPAGFTWPHASAITIDVLRTEQHEPASYRTHLDLATTSEQHQAAWVRRLLELGATRVDVGQGDVPWEVLADPDGNVFCVLEPRPEYMDVGPIAAVVTECADVAAMKRFWGEATDFVVHDDEADFVSLRSASGVGPYVELLQVPSPGEFPTRVHLDLKPYAGDDQATEADRLIALGATDTDLGQGEVSWRVMSDPEGNDFCILGADR
ncbi:VOC family protein [Galactobacter caseinivorans]|uniref:VOC family protein n=1 Tax=Galactobacter caseinivorans TaxID=2676123 RepID=A0A496PK55_9MICC|nr:VOC family protein [Galactobacter caseinivorans]RKW70838.1 VOC family protein [Galactobacter caseinivorans]